MNWLMSWHIKPTAKAPPGNRRELEAESVAYAVLAHFGMHPQSCFYLATYDVTPEMLTASLQTIGSTAKTIISLIDSTG